MDHRVDNDADEAVAAAVEKVLSATIGAKKTISQNQSTQPRKKQNPIETDTTTLEAAGTRDVEAIQPIPVAR